VTGWFTASFTGPGDSRLTVYGSEGAATLESTFGVGATRQLRVETAEGTTTLEGSGRDEVPEEFDYFAHSVLTGTRPEPDGEDGLADVRRMGEVYRDAGLDVPMAG
jgi:xylose dehydrogenase (NAD/NADP)